MEDLANTVHFMLVMYNHFTHKQVSGVFHFICNFIKFRQIQKFLLAVLDFHQGLMLNIVCLMLTLVVVKKKDMVIQHLAEEAVTCQKLDMVRMLVKSNNQFIYFLLAAVNIQERDMVNEQIIAKENVVGQQFAVQMMGLMGLTVTILQKVHTHLVVVQKKNMMDLDFFSRGTYSGLAGFSGDFGSNVNFE